MPTQFSKDGISFQYPDNWRLSREETENGWTVTVQSPDTAFFVLTRDTDMPDVGDMIETALEALRSEYPDLEADEALQTLAERPAMGHDIRFFSLDLTNSCSTRCFDTESATIFIMWQANDLELDEVEPVFRAMCASLSVEEE
jgi:hypothetical protein